MRRFFGIVISISSEEIVDEKKEIVGGVVEFWYFSGLLNIILCFVSLIDFDVFCGLKVL